MLSFRGDTLMAIGEWFDQYFERIDIDLILILNLEAASQACKQLRLTVLVVAQHLIWVIIHQVLVLIESSLIKSWKPSPNDRVASFKLADKHFDLILR
jgi:hypothetical protein